MTGTTHYLISIRDKMLPVGQENITQNMISHDRPFIIELFRAREIQEFVRYFTQGLEMHQVSE
jgi:tRNA U54 and U55 pseudouridine synthase Pus10